MSEVTASFPEIMAANPPRLVVKFKRNDDGSENFEWGVVGTIPILSLIGHISSVQTKLALGVEMHRQYDHDALVCVWDATSRDIWDFVHPVVPAEPLVGMLETIKCVVVETKMAQMYATRKHVLGPDGNPMRG